MNVLCWILQVLIALFAIGGSIWRVANYETMAKEIPSVQALPLVAWKVIAAFEILCALGLTLPGFFKDRRLIDLSAVALAVEMTLISVLHLAFFGFQVDPKNPAMWTLFLAAASAFVAFGRRKKPQDL